VRFSPRRTGVRRGKGTDHHGFSGGGEKEKEKGAARTFFFRAASRVSLIPYLICDRRGRRRGERKERGGGLSALFNNGVRSPAQVKKGDRRYHLRGDRKKKKKDAGPSLVHPITAAGGAGGGKGEGKRNHAPLMKAGHPGGCCFRTLYSFGIEKKRGKRGGGVTLGLRQPFNAAEPGDRRLSPSSSSSAGRKRSARLEWRKSRRHGPFPLHERKKKEYWSPPYPGCDVV